MAVGNSLRNSKLACALAAAMGLASAASAALKLEITVNGFGPAERRDRPARRFC